MVWGWLASWRYGRLSTATQRQFTGQLGVCIQCEDCSRRFCTGCDPGLLQHPNRVTWLGLVTQLAASWWRNLRSKGHGFDSRSGRYQVILGRVTGLRTGKSSRYITPTKVNSTFHSSAVGKLSSGVGVEADRVYLCRVTRVLSDMTGDVWNGYYTKSYTL